MDPTLEAIIKHGLSVRQIPTEVFRTYERRHFQEGDELIQQWGRTMCRRRIVPLQAGKWMCRQVKDTSSQVRWSADTDNLAPTLQESVALFLAKL